MSIVGSLTDTEIKLVFSTDRLQRLSRVYDVDGSSLVLIHEQLNELGGAIFASLSIFEIQFRNIVCFQLEEIYGENWFEHKVFNEDHVFTYTDEDGVRQEKKTQNRLRKPINDAIRRAHQNAFAKESPAERRNLRVGESGVRNRKNKTAAKKVSVTKGDVIASFYFSFWRTVFSKPYQPQIWVFGLRDIFPDKSIKRGKVSDCLETIHKVRNRIAHHEFIHPKLCRNYIEAVRFLSESLAIKGHLKKGSVLAFQQPYIKKIEYQLSLFQHTLGTLRS